MPTLNWIGNEKVINHHQDVPYKILEPKYTFVDGVQKAPSPLERAGGVRTATRLFTMIISKP